MNYVNQKEISTWIHRNAREIELAWWKYHFEHGSKEDVVNALLFYQNEDGGFGNTVNPDVWNPSSIPYATLYVLDILKDISFFDMTHPIYIGLKNYINHIGATPNGWSFTVPSINDYPHASYFHYNESYNITESLGIILGFCSFIIEFNKESILYDTVLNRMKELIDKIYTDSLGDMGPSGYITLIETMKRLNIEGYDYISLEQKLKELVNNSIQRDSKQWQYYGYRPSDYIKSKDSIFYKDNQDILEVELNYLIDTLPENDIWPISWSWFENNEIYPKEAALSCHWYKVIKGIERTKFLRTFDRLN